MSEADSPTRVKAVVKLVLVAFGVVLFAYLLSLLPPLERALPGTPISYEDALFGLAAVVVLGLFVAVGNQLEQVVDERLTSEDRAVRGTGRMLNYLVVFLAFVAVYRPLARAIVPFLAASGTAWLFDLAYVLVALGLLVAVVLPLYRSLDELARLIAMWLDGREGEPAAGEDTSDG